LGFPIQSHPCVLQQRRAGPIFMLQSQFLESSIAPLLSPSQQAGTWSKVAPAAILRPIVRNDSRPSRPAYVCTVISLCLRQAVWEHVETVRFSFEKVHVASQDAAIGGVGRLALCRT